MTDLALFCSVRLFRFLVDRVHGEDHCDNAVSCATVQFSFSKRLISRPIMTIAPFEIKFGIILLTFSRGYVKSYNA